MLLRLAGTAALRDAYRPKFLDNEDDSLIMGSFERVAVAEARRSSEDLKMQRDLWLRQRRLNQTSRILQWLRPKPEPIASSTNNDVR